IRTRRMGGGRSTTHWQVEVMQQDRQDPLAFASVVLADRRESDGHMGVEMPQAPDPDTLEVFHPPGSQGERTVLRPITGHPPFGRTDTLSTAWVREASGRSVDHLQLAFLADCRAPRSFFWSESPRLSATITLSVYFHATEQEMAEAGDDYI